ncbi:MAG TPA: TetR family transcriptional regulator C-terminal domain-containing protein [Gammaproteobacteria bacterium]|nr:TetR family transcriptional regulator C-terminal domain-containing protein [Gammaproteobacteria bacterium]
MSARGEQTRNTLIDTTRRLIHAKGVGGARIGEVLSETGLPKGSLYFHFAGKNELALAALERAGEDFDAFLERALRGPDPARRLQNFFAAVRKKHRDSGYVGGCLFGNSALETADGDPRYAALLRRVFDGWAESLQAVIADAQQAGQLRHDLPADALARQTVAVVEGGIMAARLAKSGRPLDEALETLQALLHLNPPSRRKE